MAYTSLRLVARVFAVAIVAFLVMTCSNPLTSPSSPSSSSTPSAPATSANSKVGSLTIKINNNINPAKTLVPGISMIAASYTVTGTGPPGSGATFTQAVTNGLATINARSSPALGPCRWMPIITRLPLKASTSAPACKR